MKRVLTQGAPHCLHIISKRIQVEIPLSEIRFIEVYDWKCIVHCAAGICHETNIPLKQLQKQLPEKQFIRCNRSYVVNLDHVISIENDVLVTDSGERVPITKRSRQDVRMRCAEYLWRKAAQMEREQEQE